MVKCLTSTLELRLQKARLNPQLLVVRVKIANQLVNSAVWYMTTLWTANMQQLEQFDKIIKDFVNSGQETGKHPRVDYATITRPKSEGGLGLISIKAQNFARVKKTILWIVGDGDHSLQWILRAKIADLSKKRLGY